MTTKDGADLTASISGFWSVELGSRWCAITRSDFFDGNTIRYTIWVGVSILIMHKVPLLPFGYQEMLLE